MSSAGPLVKGFLTRKFLAEETERRKETLKIFIENTKRTKKKGKGGKGERKGEEEKGEKHDERVERGAGTAGVAVFVW